MARPVPKTKAGKERKVGNVMGEFKAGDLKSSSGEKVTNPKQAIAIALSQTGQSKPPSKRRGGATARIARTLDRRLDQKSP